MTSIQIKQKDYAGAHRIYIIKSDHQTFYNLCNSLITHEDFPHNLASIVSRHPTVQDVTNTKSKACRFFYVCSRHMVTARRLNESYRNIFNLDRKTSNHKSCIRIHYIHYIYYDTQNLQRCTAQHFLDKFPFKASSEYSI